MAKIDAVGDGIYRICEMTAAYHAACHLAQLQFRGLWFHPEAPMQQRDGEQRQNQRREHEHHMYRDQPAHLRGVEGGGC